MESVNELLKLFMRQVRREKLRSRPSGLGSDVPPPQRAPRSARQRSSSISKDITRTVEVHDHD